LKCFFSVFQPFLTFINPKLETETSLANPNDISIYNINGELIFQSNWIKNSWIKVADYDLGMYFYVLENNVASSIGKFIKK
jgi:hypothetical protein